MNILEHAKAGYRSWALLLLSVPVMLASPFALAGEIHDAAKAGDLDRVQKLVVQGVDVNARAVRDETPLMYAALAGNGEIVNYLLKHGADINARSTPGMTALHAAAYAGHTDIVSLLVGKGANVNDSSNLYKTSPLLVASEGNHFETVKALLNHGADVTIANASGFNAISEAGFREYWDVLRLLLENGAECQPAEKTGEWLYSECKSRVTAN